MSSKGGEALSIIHVIEALIVDDMMMIATSSASGCEI
jgi:hypothetical protein